MSRLLAFRQQRQTLRRRLAITSGAALFLLIAMSVVLVRYVSQKNASTTGNTVVVAQTVNLWDAETLRGKQPVELESVTLPAAVIRLTIILPRHSPPGQYLLAITRDQSGNGLIAEGNSSSVGTGSAQQITAELDLRRASAGRYFLSTTHAQDEAAYYYPLQVR